MIKEAIHQLAAKHDLSYDTAAAVMDEIMGQPDPDVRLPHRAGHEGGDHR